MNRGDLVIVKTDNCRLPKGTVCIVEEVLNETHDKPYYIRNRDSQYCCWASSGDLRLLEH